MTDRGDQIDEKAELLKTSEKKRVKSKETPSIFDDVFEVQGFGSQPTIKGPLDASFRLEKVHLSSTLEIKLMRIHKAYDFFLRN